VSTPGAYSVVCHIGLHKTASGALQRQFFPACSGVNLFTTQQRYTDDFIRAVTCMDPIYFDAQAATGMVLPHMSVDRVNLISNESLSGPPYAGLIEYGLDHRGPVLYNLREAFPEARIIIVLRRQDSLARSLYRQYLKRGGTVRIDRFFGVSRNRKPALMPLERFRYSRYLDLLTGLFPAGVKFMLFEDFVADRQGFLSDLCDFIGVECPDIDLVAENATRLGPVGMEVSRWGNFWFRSMINQGPIPAVPRKRFGRWRLVSPVEYVHDYWPGRGKKASRLASRVCAGILAEVSEDNRMVDARYKLGLAGRGYY
jgi:hypothetical protein